MKPIIGCAVACALFCVSATGQSTNNSANRALGAKQDALDNLMRERELVQLQQKQLALERQIQQQANQPPPQIQPPAQKKRQTVIIPGETQAERQARHEQVIHSVKQAYAAGFAQQHPFLPSSYQPPIPESAFEKAIRDSDSQFAKQTQQRETQQIAEELRALRARVAQLEADQKRQKEAASKAKK